MNAAALDRSILRAVGLMLARDEHGTARPVAAPVVASHIAWRRCGWCHSNLGLVVLETPTPGMFTDTICPGCRAKFFAGQQKEAA